MVNNAVPVHTVMRFTPLSFRCFLLLALSQFALFTAELPNPLSDLTARSLIATLAALRPVLTEKPDDPAAWGVATTTYALLAMQGAREQWGGLGPWYDYAHRAAQRVAAPAQATTLDQALPGLWVALLDHDDRVVVDTLERLRADPALPAVRALRAMAMGNPDGLDRAATPIEAFAQLVATIAAGKEEVYAGRASRRLDLWTMQAMTLQTDRGGDRQAALRQVAMDAAWLMQSPRIPDADADARLVELAQAAGGTLDATLERAARISQCEALLRGLRDDPATKIAAYVAAYRAVEVALAGPRGWEGNRPTGLFGLGDVARWQWDRLFVEAYLLTMFDRDEVIATVVEGIARALGPVLPVLRMRAVNGTTQMANLAALATALEQESSASGSRSYGWYPRINCLTRLVTQGYPDGQRLTTAFFATVDPADLRPLERVVALSHLSSFGSLYPRLRQAAERSPWHFDFYRLAHAMDPATPMLTDPGNGTDWTTATVDYPQGGFIPGGPEDLFGLRLVGRIAFPAGGTWQVTIESDDGSRLVVGDTVVDNPGDHPMQRATGVITLEGPATLPLRLDFYERGGGQGLRLWWRGPGMTTDTIVPAAALSHDQGPGLRGVLWRFADNQALERALQAAAPQAWSEQVPWNRSAVLERAAFAERTGDWETVLNLGPRLKDANAAYQLESWILEAGVLHQPALSIERLANCLPDEGRLRMSSERGTPLIFNAADEVNGPRMLAALRLKGGRVSGFMLLLRLQASLAAGDLQDALDMATLIERDDWCNSTGTGFCTWVKEALVLRVLLTRMLVPDRAVPPLGTRMDHCCTNPYYHAFGAWLDGAQTWDETVASLDEHARTAYLPFVHALYLIDRGQLVDARAELVAFKHASQPNNTYHHFTASIITWLDGLDDAGRAKLGRAPALKGGDTRWSPGSPEPVPAAEGTTNF